jgi:hypothetical protein
MFPDLKSCIHSRPGFNSFGLIFYLVTENSEFFLNSLLLR